MIATHEGYIDTVEVLLKHKCNVNACDSDQQTALMGAVETDQVEIVKLLLDNGADIDPSEKHHSALMVMAWGGLCRKRR